MDTKQRKNICELSKDMMKVYRYHGHVSVINAMLSAEADMQQGREYLNRNGHSHLFH